MARIRTIKPEFPQSESMGRVSRDARLLFIMLWTIADDAGRLRGNSRMLASLLFPYDDDAKRLIDGWLEELSSQGCLAVYMVGNDTYVEICNWLNHQKIDKPSRSKIPAFLESSRRFAKVREGSSEDQRKGSEDQGGDQGKDHDAPAEAVATAMANLFLFGFCPPMKPQKTRKAAWVTAEHMTSTLAGLTEPVATGYLAFRRSKGAALTDLAWKSIAAEVVKSGMSPDSALPYAMNRGWQGFDSTWIPRTGQPSNGGKPSKHDLSNMDYSKGADADGKF